MNLPELETKRQYYDFVTAVKCTSKFGGFTGRVYSYIYRDQLEQAQRSIENFWAYTTKRQKEQILVSYVSIRLGNR